MSDSDRFSSVGSGPNGTPYAYGGTAAPSDSDEIAFDRMSRLPGSGGDNLSSPQDNQTQAQGSSIAYASQANDSDRANELDGDAFAQTERKIGNIDRKIFNLDHKIARQERVVRFKLNHGGNPTRLMHLVSKEISQERKLTLKRDILLAKRANSFDENKGDDFQEKEENHTNISDTKIDLPNDRHGINSIANVWSLALSKLTGNSVEIIGAPEPSDHKNNHQDARALTPSDPRLPSPSALGANQKSTDQNSPISPQPATSAAPTQQRPSLTAPLNPGTSGPGLANPSKSA